MEFPDGEIVCFYQDRGAHPKRTFGVAAEPQGLCVCRLPLLSRFLLLKAVPRSSSH